MEPESTGIRIVSKGEYVVNISRKIVSSSFGLGLLTLSFVLVLSVGILLGSLNTMAQSDPPIAVCLAFIVLPFSFAAYYALQLGRRTIKEARQIDIGAPFTRANTGQLPAVESLVRASEKPVQEQQSILLRPSAEQNGTPADQMLRPVDGGTVGVARSGIEERFEYEI